MSEDDFKQLLENFEGDSLEFRVDISSQKGEEKQRTAKTVVSFYNTQGGKIIFGVKEDGKTRKVVGLRNPQITESNIMNQVSTKCGLDENPSYEFIKFQGHDVLILTCRKGERPPYNFEGTVLVRRGSNNLPASKEEIGRMYRDSSNNTHDRTVVQNASIVDIDLDAAESYLEGLKLLKDEPEKEDTNKIFCKIGLLVERDGKYIPTIAGVLLYGKNPQLFFPNATIKADVKEYDDDEEWEEILDIRGSIINQIEEAERFFLKHVEKRAKIIGFRRIEEEQISYIALREALVNAVAHRDYGISDASIQIKIRKKSITIISPGYIKPPLTLEAILDNKPFVPLTRNPVLAEEILRNGFMERRGNGFLLIKKEIKKRGLQEPEFIEESGSFVVKFNLLSNKENIDGIFVPNEVWESVNTDQDEEKILQIIEAKTKVTLKDFEIGLKKTRGAFMKKVDRLLESNVIERHPPKPKKSPKAYYTIHSKFTDKRNKDGEVIIDLKDREQQSLF